MTLSFSKDGRTIIKVGLLDSAGPQMIPRPTMRAESLRSFLDKARKRKAQILAKPSFKQSIVIILEKQRIVVLNLQWTPSRRCQVHSCSPTTLNDFQSSHHGCHRNVEYWLAMRRPCRRQFRKYKFGDLLSKFLHNVHTKHAKTWVGTFKILPPLQ